ncbi:MAG: ATP-dependent DNA helicase RecG [Burkholderiaceae bacterium]|nr:ATP-dependent DNA helicase RecG [Burkholderiaceae bacterium]
MRTKSNTKTPKTPSREGSTDPLEKMGLTTPVALAFHLPIRYEDETKLWSIDEACALGFQGPIQTQGRVIRSQVVYRPRRQLLVAIEDDTGVLNLRWLNFYPSQQKQMAVGVHVRVRGDIRDGYFGPEMVHPTVRVVSPDAPLPKSLTPVYSVVAGVSQAKIRKAVLNALKDSRLEECLAETIPKSALSPAAQSVMQWSLRDSIHYLHQPPVDANTESIVERTHPAWRRVQLEELLAQQISLKQAHASRRARPAPPKQLHSPKEFKNLPSQLMRALAFELTDAQQRVWSEITFDLTASFPMNRLLQGDVGSGKTIIAALASAQMVERSFQAAIMAPTEILAEQHYWKFKEWFEPLGVRVVWLSGGGLAVIDEQHRFGVRQRMEITQRIGSETYYSHQLMMSATPIPRTLAMTYYADLDVSVIDELPPGRQAITTKLVKDARRQEVIEGLKQWLQKGLQAYWVCPLIEESEALQLQTAVASHAELSEYLSEYTLALIHGRLKADEKATIMAAFKAGQIDVLVATTVIEVGVDVPNAALMVIEHAERFGYAQIHQLRGRVGRGSNQSACILMYSEPLSLAAKERLQTLREVSDGFVIAERDLALRGPGELLGARQSGEAMLRFVDLQRDAWLIQIAQELAEHWLRNHPELVEAHLGRWLGSRTDFLKA